MTGHAGIVVKGQYIKDLSFENPNAPQSLLNMSDSPKIDVSVNLRAQKLNDSMYEMTMLLSVKATSPQMTLFLVELSYAGIFEMVNIPAEKIEQALLIDSAYVLFPFARRVVSDVTRDGGLPPLMLDPIDFRALYEHNQAQLSRSGTA